MNYRALTILAAFVVLAGCGEEIQPICPADMDCGGRQCGADPICGVSCGDCEQDEVCTSEGVCVNADCTPSCGDRLCGPDPVCGFSCGDCEQDEVCTSQGVCVNADCTPACGDRLCGPDPVCGFSCGECEQDDICTSEGVCATPDGPSSLTVTGLGGGGGLFIPSVSPYDPDVMLVSCDMGGSYNSFNGGRRWAMIHREQISRTSTGTYPAYLPGKILWHTGRSVRMSLDGGATWSKVASMPWGSDVPKVLAAVAGPPETLFVGTEAGLWRSEDNGENWSRVIDGATREVVEAGGKLYTIGGPARGTLLLSEDLGETWISRTIAVGGSPMSQGVVSLTGGAEGGDTVLFASVENLGVLRSRDDGVTWSVVVQGYDSQSILQMAANQTRKVYAAQSRGTDGSSCGSACQKVWRSSDGGDSWQETFRMTGANPNVELAWVQTELRWGYYITRNGFYASHSDADVAMVSTQGDLYVTRDGGDTWSQLINENLGVLDGDPSSRYRSIGLEVTSSWRYLFDPFRSGYEFIAYSDIGFARTIDGADTWSWAARGCPWVNTFYDVAFDPEVEGRMYVAASNRHDIPHWIHLSPNGPSHRGGVCVSQDRAQSWTSSSVGLPERPATTIALDPQSPTDNRTLWVGIFGEGIFKSTDGGVSWIIKSQGLGNSSGDTSNLHVYRIRLHPQTGNLFALITARRVESSFDIPGGVWKSSDGGETWTDVTASNPLAWPTDFALHPTNENTIYVTAATAPGRPQGGLWKTTNGGASWTHVLDDARLSLSGGSSYDHTMAVTIHPTDPSQLFVGTTLNGLWYSADAGDTWHQDRRFPFSSAQSITVHPQGHSNLYVTTFGGGVWVVPWPPPSP